MRKIRLLGAAMLAVAATVVAQAPLAAQAEAEHAEAREAAEAWLALFDADQFDESWDAASTSFQAALTAEQWAAQGSNVRMQVGAFEAREPAAAQGVTDPPGAPPGEYVQFLYNSQFGSGPMAEVVVMVRDGDRGWRLAGYVVRPPA